MRKSLLWFLAVLFIGINTVCASSIPFSVKAEIPENQIDKKQTYYDLKLMPGEEQSIYLAVNNTSEDEIKISVSLYPASTERNGLIIYSEPKSIDKSMKVPITDIAVLQQQNLTIPGKSSKNVQVDIKMPEEEFDGIILGGISVGLDSSMEAGVSNSGLNISNEFVYVTGLKISQNDNKVEPEMNLNYIVPGLINYSPSLIFNIQNAAPMIMKDVAIKAEIYKSGSNEVFRTYENLYCQFAPNSNGDFVIDWDNKKLEDGKYQVIIWAEYEDIQWEWNEEITITQEEAGEVNEGGISVIETDNNSNFWLLFIIAILIVIALIFFFLGRRSRDEHNKK